MLVLTRKVKQSVEIGAATVRILSMDGGQVKIGVEADLEIRVLRSELLDPEELAEPPAPLPLRAEDLLEQETEEYSAV